jgi:2-(1,2-epoxy-1,2-dihydrophenyl)acetyl-CoA isomerase
MGLIKVHAGLEGRMVRLTLNRPDKLNAFDPPMLRELADYIRNISETKARLVVIDAEGKAFSAGGDLSIAGTNSSMALGGLAKQFHAVLEALAGLDAVIATVVQGAAVGGGFAVALAGDIRIGTPEAKFRVGYGRAGLTVDGGISWKLPRLIGFAQAQRILVEDPDIDADEALALGLLHHVLPAADIPKKCEEILHATETQSRMAISRNRALLHASSGRGWLESLTAEADMVRLSAATSDGMEGIKAFLEKRPPKFTS